MKDEVKKNFRRLRLAFPYVSSVSSRSFAAHHLR
jgi:hypothetical protein